MITLWLSIALLTSCVVNRQHVPRSDDYAIVVIGRVAFCLAWPIVLIFCIVGTLRSIKP